MLNQITLKKFRQFDDKTVVFGEGNIVLRGANEAGKSTIIEGMMYLMGGTKQCRNSDFVQWGAKPGQCIVEGLFTFQGHQIRATRGPRGAEVYVPADAEQPTITGQSEVTEFFAEQIGTSMDIAAKMMFAGQKEIGGLLDERSGKVIEFIEDMSGLDIVDWLVTRITESGELGATKPIEEDLALARERLEGEASLDFDSVIKNLEADLPQLEQDVQAAAAGLANAQDDLKAAQACKSRHDVAQARYEAAVEAHDRTKEALAAARAGLEKLEAQAQACRPVEGINQRLEEIDAERSALTGRAEVSRIHKQFLAYKAPEDVWEGTVEDLDAYIAEVEQEVANLQAEQQRRVQAVKDRRAEVSRHRANVVEVGKKCRSCGQMIPDAEGAAEHNKAELARAAELEAEIPALERAAAELDPKIVEARENLSTARSVRSQRPFAAAEAHPELFTLDLNQYPPAVAWAGGDVSDPAPEISRLTEEARTLREERDQALATLQSVRAGRERVQTAEQGYGEAKSRMEALASAEDLLTPGRLKQLLADIDAFSLAAGQASAANQAAVLALAERRSALKHAQDSKRRHDEDVANAHEAVRRLEKKLAAYTFNNDLIAALRRARPAVANQLWNMILKGVSTYLTAMRGEASIVERVDKTFTVNGKPYSSYSGSALDLLALGIRIGLAKVFVPSADMLVLDEPFAACSVERTMQCLSFTAAAGFAQTIIITHEEQSSEVFDKLVEV